MHNAVTEGHELVRADPKAGRDVRYGHKGMCDTLYMSCCAERKGQSAGRCTVRAYGALIGGASSCIKKRSNKACAPYSLGVHVADDKAKSTERRHVDSLVHILQVAPHQLCAQVHPKPCYQG